jgi:hypothetical protein
VTDPSEFTLDGKLQSVDRFVREDVPRTRWAVDDVWPEGASGLIAGPPKAGKSTFALELAISLSCGVPFLGLFDVPRRMFGTSVTYIQAENSTSRVRRDLDEILTARGQGFMDEVDIDPELGITGHRFRPTAWSREQPDLLIGSHTGIDLLDKDHQREFLDHAVERDYVILDPVYLLASMDPNEMGEVNRVFRFLNLVRETDTAVIITHQMSNKQGTKVNPGRILGSTMFNAWYEAAILTARRPDDSFTVTFDNLREMGTSEDFQLLGTGTGRWDLLEPPLDSEGKYNHQLEQKRLRIRRYKKLREEHPGWDNNRLADEMEVSTKTIRRYEEELASNNGDVPPATREEDGSLYGQAAREERRRGRAV